MSSDPQMLQSNFPQSRGCPYFNRDHDRLPSLSHPHSHLLALAHPSLSQHHHHPNNNNNNNNNSSGITFGSETNYNHPSRQHTQSAGQPQHAVHPRAQPPPQTNNINHANHSNISSTNHTSHSPPRLPLPLFDPVHANNNNHNSNASNAWYQQGPNPGRHVQTYPVGVPAPPLPQMNSESNAAASAAAAAAAAASGAAAAAEASSIAGSAPDSPFGRGNGASLGPGLGLLSGAPATGRGPAPGNAAGNATSGSFHSVLAQPGGVPAANGHHQEAYPYDPSGLGGGPGAYHFPSGMSRQHRSQAALASHLSQLNYRLGHDINRQEGHQSQLYTQPQHQHHPQHHPQQQPQHQPQQQRRHRATGSIGRSHQPVSNLRGPNLPALVAPFHTPISIPAMATESTAPVDSSPNATPPHAHDSFYGGAGESRPRLPGPYSYSATGDLMVEVGASMAPSHAEPPASAPSADSSPTADHRRNQAQARLRASLQADYDSGDEPYAIEDMLADDDATMQFIEQISHEAGAAREQRHNFEEVRIRQQQLLRGQMSTKRVASKRALSQLQTVDIASLDEGEKSKSLSLPYPSPAPFSLLLLRPRHANHLASLCHLLQRVWNSQPRRHSRGSDTPAKLPTHFRRALHQEVVRGVGQLSVLPRQGPLRVRHYPQQFDTTVSPEAPWPSSSAAYEARGRPATAVSLMLDALRFR